MSKNKRFLLNPSQLISQTSLQEIKEENQTTEGFKFNNVSDMDKSGDKSSTRYDAKFIEDDEMNYDPEIVNPSNTSNMTQSQDGDQGEAAQNSSNIL